jgi:hypothetical protein
LGDLSEKLVIEGDAQAAFRTTLKITVRIEPRLAFEKPQILFDLPFGVTKSEEVTLIGKVAREAVISVKRSGERGYFC